MRIIPPLSFPTHVILIDDNHSFLEAMGTFLKRLDKEYAVYDDASLFLNDINLSSKPELLINRYLEDSYDEESGAYKRVFNINIEDFHKEIYLKDRFEIFSVVIIDYDMPGTNGLQVIEKIKSPFIQKILLTGAADEHLAVEAFNKGLINKFIQKQDKNMLTLLEKCLIECERSFFEGLYKTLFSTFEANNHKNPLQDDNFSQLFYKLVDKYHIIEYYLFSPSGSYIMLDADGNHYDLFVFSKDELDEMIMYAQDMKASEGLLNDLKSYRKAICFFNPEDQTLTNDSTLWTPYIQPIQSIDGLEEYYYVCKPNIINIPRESYISFNQYRATLKK